MIRFLTLAMVVLAVGALASTVQAGHRRSRGGSCCCTAVAPAAAPAAAPAEHGTAPAPQASQGVRRYSYEPSMGTYSAPTARRYYQNRSRTPEFLMPKSNDAKYR